jgi:hypothetical protein
MSFIILIFNNNYVKILYMAVINRPVKRVIFNRWSYMTLFRSLWERGIGGDFSGSSYLNHLDNNRREMYIFLK